MPKCNKCKSDKLDVDFNFNKTKGRLEYHCKSCHSNYLKDHYRRNKVYYVEKATKRTNEIREWFQEYKTTLKCSKCGESHVACLDFHHVDPKSKDIEICLCIARGWTKERIMNEIAKCIVLCSNCHRKLHWELKLDAR
jgi:hypothetical protein